MMVRRWLIMMVMLMAASACTLVDVVGLAGSTGVRATAAPPPTVQFSFPTRTPMPPLPATALPPPATCNAPAGWVTYVVVAGDTLGSIARRANTTAALLAQVNCLTNPNVIHTGNLLYVPRTPAPNPPTPVPPPGVTQIGQVRLNPYVSFDGFTFVVTAGTALTVTWPEFPQDATQVEFVYYPYSGGSASLGVDGHMADGAAVVWGFPRGTGGTLIASARFAGSERFTESFPVAVVFGSAPLPSSPTLYIYPVLATEGNTLILRDGETISITWPFGPLPLFTRVDFFFLGSLIGTDTNLADEARIEWTVPAGANGVINAIATLTDGRTIESQPTRVVAGGPATATAVPPTIPPPTTAPSEPAYVGQVSASPIITADGGAVVVPAGQVILEWGAAPREALYVEFYFAPAGTGMPSGILSTDPFPSDGATIAWNVPPGTLGHASAAAFSSDGRIIARTAGDLFITAQ